MDKFIIDRLRVIARNIRQNNDLAVLELKEKSNYISPKYSFDTVMRNNAEIVAELQDIILYEASGRTPPQHEHDGSKADLLGEACRDFGYGDTPHGIDGMITANIKQVASELLRGRNALNRAGSCMYYLIGMCKGHSMFTDADKQLPPMCINNLNRVYNLFRIAKKAFEESVDILCSTVDFTPPDAEQSSQTAISYNG